MAEKDRPALPFHPEPSVAGVPPFDPAEYMEFIETLPLTEAQKIEFLQTLWNIMAAFVNYGLGVDSVIPLLAQKASENSEGELQETIPTHEFNVAADDDATESEA